MITELDWPLRYYQEFIDVDLSVLSEGEEVQHRSSALFRNRLLTTKSGSLILTPERVLFLSPIHRIARWRNCELSISLEGIDRVRSLRWVSGRLKYIIHDEALTIFMRGGGRHDFWYIDSAEWCGAISHQRELARQ